jgi:hypothetical protein
MLASSGGVLKDSAIVTRTSGVLAISAMLAVGASSAWAIPDEANIDPVIINLASRQIRPIRSSFDASDEFTARTSAFHPLRPSFIRPTMERRRAFVSEDD